MDRDRGDQGNRLSGTMRRAAENVRNAPASATLTGGAGLAAGVSAGAVLGVTLGWTIGFLMGLIVGMPQGERRGRELAR